MKTFVTLLATLVTAPVALTFGQAGPPLGSDFIFFRNGTNASIPHVAGNLEADPSAPSEVSIRYDYGDWSYQSFSWERGVGVDMTGNLSSNDILHLKLKVDQGNAGKENTFIMFEDKTNDSPDDLPMRLVWRIPENLKDGNWHTLDIPLPPEKCADLASARGTLGLADNWWYGGSWSNATQRVGDYDDLCGSTTNNPQYWKEFEWTNVKSLGAFWDHNSGGGSIWYDDVYVGSAGLDLSIADAPPAAMSGVSYTPNASGNKISWTHDPQSKVGAYRVYASSLFPMESDAINLGIAHFLGQVNASATDFSLDHYFHYLHPTLAQFLFPMEFNYAVTTVSQFGIENTDVSLSASTVSNNLIGVGPMILELTPTESSVLFNDVTAGNASGAGFHPGWLPFEINQNRFRIADVPTPPDSDSDLSGIFYLGHNADNEMYLYAEVMDDDVQLPPSEDPGSAPWEYDVIEMGWANYDLAEDPFVGDPLIGSLHQDMERGDEADYQFRIGGKGDGSQAFVWVDPGVGGVPAASTAAYDVLTDTLGNAIGYKILALIPLDGIQDDATGDAVVLPPLGDESVARAINIVLNDRDGGTRQSQIQWTLKNTADGQWWHTPAQWEPVGMIGRSSWPVSAETSTLPESIALDQNYPNPFNPQTNISFSLPSAETVTLTVHDLLGRTVATVISGQVLGAGTHTLQFDGRHLASGIYLYRLQAGTSFVQTRRMTLIK